MVKNVRVVRSEVGVGSAFVGSSGVGSGVSVGSGSESDGVGSGVSIGDSLTSVDDEVE